MIVPTLPNADSLDHAAAASACCFRPASTTNIYTVSAAAAVRRYHRRHSVPRLCRHCTDRLESLLQREITEIDSQVSTSCCTYSTSTNNFWSYYCYSAAAAISSWYFSIISWFLNCGLSIQNGPVFQMQDFKSELHSSDGYLLRCNTLSPDFISVHQWYTDKKRHQPTLSGGGQAGRGAACCTLNPFL